MKHFSILLVLLLLPRIFLAAAEYNEGDIRLVLTEKTGRFSLYFKNQDSQYEPVIFEQDPRTSFISVLLNDRAYKLGDTMTFRTNIGSNPDVPSLIFESSQLIVTQEFFFIKTAGSNIVNGVEIKITLESKSAAEINAGFRFLLDTFLGEPGSAPHFLIDLRPVTSETLINKGSDDIVWFSRNSSLSLMGSLNLPERQNPDSVYFANWKRLSDVAWKMPFDGSRNFNSPPYSIGDSAVCYYFEPRSYSRGETFSASVLLAKEDSRGFAPLPSEAVIAAASPAQRTSGRNAELPNTVSEEDGDLVLLQDLISRIDNYLLADDISEEELAAMEQTLDRLKLKYGNGSGLQR